MMTTAWGYSLVNGPTTWSEVFPDAAGEKQSPVDIKKTEVKPLNCTTKLTWKYVPENTIDISNPGYCWKVHVKGTGSELYGGPLKDNYQLEQFHCHWGADDESGSEHRIDGKSYAGEIHLVHWNTKYNSFEQASQHPDGLAVVAIFLKPGRKHFELDKVVAQLSKVQFKGEKAIFVIPLDPGSLIPPESGYWTYQGSLTTPPCSECVTWIIFKEPIEVSREQLKAFRKLRCYCRDDTCPCDQYEGFVKDNFRPPAPLNNREVREYSPTREICFS
ncbi:carbonic anhydrase 13-like isoform X2 [Agrilus planipennis]|uniref:Carbonic anhydrase n=1 Tax=Agrilus planipennis TaxID=224129 RepID=A0A1W4WKL6_AGRPL|nr:carbonic anhydrase 13-like isoform X2 [Agrilus planipennis]